MLRCVLKNLGKTILFIAFSFKLSATFALAMSVTPLTAELEPDGRGKSTTIRVHNDAATPIPVEIDASRLFVSETGQSSTQPAGGKFIIFPPQATIAPGASQSFRIQWSGPRQLESSESYILSVKQLPVILDTAKSGVQIVFNFSVLVNVSPKKASPAISVVETTVLQGQPNRTPIITVKNSGTRHALLSEGKITLQSGAWTETFEGARVQKLVGGLGFIAPGEQRRFHLATTLPSNISSYQARIDLRNGQ